MSITSTDIHEQGFGTSRNGYDMQEVDDFLEFVANEIDHLHADYQNRIAELENSTMIATASPAQDAEIESLRLQVASLQSKLSEQRADESVISDAFISAQKSANKIKEQASDEAARIRREAEGRAREMITETQAEKQRILDEIDRLEQSRQAFVNDFISLLKHFETDANRTFESKGLQADNSESHVIAFKDSSADRSFGNAPSASDDSYRNDDPIPVSNYSPESMPEPKAASIDSETFEYGETGGIDVDELD